MSRWQYPQGATVTCLALLVLVGCVSQQQYDTLEAQYQQPNQTMAAEGRRQPDADHALAKRH